MSAVEPNASTLVRPRDLWNPILVKETRQALRGKTFRYTFLGTLATVLLAALTSALGRGVNVIDAEAYFLAVYFCLVVAVVAIVPFSAFQAMGGEWDESTFDLLVLSDLRPRRIVLGKLQSAGVQALLFTSAFTPFLVVAFLLPGIDLRVCVILIAITLVVGSLATLVGMALSTLSRQRFVRVVLMVTLGGLIAMTVPTMMAMASAALQVPDFFMDQAAYVAIAMAGSVALIGAAYTFCLACNMLAHPEENRSSNVRIVTTLGSIVMLLLGAVVSRTLTTGGDFISGMAMTGIMIVSCVSVLFMTERRELGRRVRARVPRTPLIALVSAPWFPGGGRGVMLHVIHVVSIALVGICIVVYDRPGSSNFLEDGVGALLVAVPISIAYVTVVPGLLARWCESPGTRLAVRIATPVIVFLVIIVPGIVGALNNDRQLGNLEYFANPARVIAKAWDEEQLALELFFGFVAVALVALLINAPRLVRSVTETLEASRINRLRAEGRSDAPAEQETIDAGTIA